MLNLSVVVAYSMRGSTAHLFYAIPQTPAWRGCGSRRPVKPEGIEAQLCGGASELAPPWRFRCSAALRADLHLDADEELEPPRSPHVLLRRAEDHLAGNAGAHPFRVATVQLPIELQGLSVCDSCVQRRREVALVAGGPVLGVSYLVVTLRVGHQAGWLG